MSPPENVDTRGKFLINLSIGIGLNDAFSHSLHSYCNLLFLNPISFLSFYAMLSIFEIPDKLSTIFDSLPCINLKLSIKFSLCVIVLPLLSSFLIVAKKVIYFSGFSPKHSNFSAN